MLSVEGRNDYDRDENTEDSLLSVFVYVISAILCVLDGAAHSAMQLSVCIGYRAIGSRHTALERLSSYAHQFSCG